MLISEPRGVSSFADRFRDCLRFQTDDKAVTLERAQIKTVECLDWDSYRIEYTDQQGATQNIIIRAAGSFWYL